MRKIKLLGSLIRRNVKALCHKQDSLMRGALSSVFCNQKTLPLNATSDKCHQLATVRRHFVYNTWRSHGRQHAKKQDIGRKYRFSYPTCIRRNHYWVPVGILP